VSPRRIVRSICFECHSRCGALIEVDNDRIVNVKGDKDHPFSKGFICPKCRATKEIIYHPERLTNPAKRVGEKGKGKVDGFVKTTFPSFLDALPREEWFTEG